MSTKTSKRTKAKTAVTFDRDGMPRNPARVRMVREIGKRLFELAGYVAVPVSPSLWSETWESVARVAMEEGTTLDEAAANLIEEALEARSAAAIAAHGGDPLAPVSPVNG